MLVLDRRLEEGFWIDDRIFVKVLGITKNRIKLGIEAPAEVPILRDELVGEGKRSAKNQREQVTTP